MDMIMIKCLEHMIVIHVESTGLETAVGDILVIVVTVLMCESPMCILTTETSTWQVHGALVLELTYFAMHLLDTGCIS